MTFHRFSFFSFAYFSFLSLVIVCTHTLTLVKVWIMIIMPKIHTVQYRQNIIREVVEYLTRLHNPPNLPTIVEQIRARANFTQRTINDYAAAIQYELRKKESNTKKERK